MILYRLNSHEHPESKPRASGDDPRYLEQNLLFDA